MKPKKKLKKKKNDKDNKDIINSLNDEIIPSNHGKEGNINFYSEEISKCIIEKLISLAISSDFGIITSKKMNDFCSDELIKKINDLVEIFNINHEIDDFNNSEYILSNIKYLKTDTNEKRYKMNNHTKAKTQRNYIANKVLFDTANINKTEEIEMFIKNKEVKDYLNKTIEEKNNLDLIKRNKIQYDIEISKENFWGNITQPKSYFIDRTSSLFNNLKKGNNIIFQKIKTDKKKTTILKKKFNLYHKKKFKELNDEEYPKKKFHPILQMPFIELPMEENKNKETEDIIKIRNEQILLEQAKIEKLKKLELNKKNKIKENIIKGKYTTDIEGKIVLIKEIYPENLLKEFLPVSTQQKELLAGQSLENLHKNEALMEKKAKKNIIFNRKRINEINLSLNPIFNSILKQNKESEKDIKSSKNNNVIIKQPLEEETTNFFPFSFIHKMEKIVLGGSNFKIMTPSSGVNIKEKNQVKSGAMDHFKTFHKYSLNEFNKILKDTLAFERSKLSGNYLTNNINPINRDIIKEEKNYELKRKINNNKYKINNFRKTFSDNFRPKKIIQKSTSEVFTLRENRNTLRELLMHEDDFNINNKIKKIWKNSSYNNIFERYILTPHGRMSTNNKNQKEINFNLVDNFNKDLILGYYQSARSRNILPIIPPKKSVILNSNRINNYNYIRMNSTMNNFFRTRQKRNTELVESLSSNNIRNKKIII